MELIVIIKSDVISGHEKMAIKLIALLQRKPDLILVNESARYQIKVDQSLVGFSWKKLFGIRFRVGLVRLPVLIVNGSPYGNLQLKLILFLLGFRVIEYVPFPELTVIQDRFHHRFVPTFNRLTISMRILIDDWQVPLSSVRKVVVVRNLV